MKKILLVAVVALLFVSGCSEDEKMSDGECTSLASTIAIIEFQKLLEPKPGYVKKKSQLDYEKEQLEKLHLKYEKFCE